MAHHELLRTLSAVDITTIRFLIVSAVLVAVNAVLPHRMRTPASPPRWSVTIVFALLAVPGSQLALTAGQRYLSPGMSGLTAAVGPAFAALLALFFLGERLGRRTWFGVGLAIIGVAGVVFLSSGSGTTRTIRNPAGAALVPLGQLSWAAFTVLSRSFSGREAPIRMITRVVTVGTLALLPAVPGAALAATRITAVEWLWLLHLALLGTVVPYLVWTTALKHLPAGETAAFMFLVPIMAATWSAVILGERPTGSGLAAGAIVLAGVALTQTDRRIAGAASKVVQVNRPGPREGEPRLPT